MHKVGFDSTFYITTNWLHTVVNVVYWPHLTPNSAELGHLLEGGSEDDEDFLDSGGDGESEESDGQDEEIEEEEEECDKKGGKEKGKDKTFCKPL